MSELIVELCPETGICSLVRSGADKVDLMPDEVEAIREAAGDPERIKAAIAESDTAFAAGLTADEIASIKQWVK